MKNLVQRFTAIMNSVSTVMGYSAGMGFLLLSIYIGWEATARKYGLPYTGFSDEVATYTLAIAGCWGMGYAMKEGAHVRIEVLTALFSKVMQRRLLMLATFCLTLFAGFLAYHMFGLAMESQAFNGRGFSGLRAPLVIPQSLAAFGLLVFALQGCAIFFCQLLGIDPNKPGEDHAQD